MLVAWARLMDGRVWLKASGTASWIQTIGTLKCRFGGFTLVERGGERERERVSTIGGQQCLRSIKLSELFFPSF